MNDDLFLQIVSGRIFSTGDYEHTCFPKAPAKQKELIARLREQRPDFTGLSYLIAHSIDCSNGCAKRGGKNRDYTSPELLHHVFDLDTDSELLKMFVAGGGKTVYLTSGRDPALATSYYERLIIRLITEWRLEVAGLGGDFAYYQTLKVLTSYRAVYGRLALAGLRTFNEDPNVLSDEVRPLYSNVHLPVREYVKVLEAITELSLPVHTWFNVGWEDDDHIRFEHLANLRKFIDSFGGDGRNPVKSITLSFYSQTEGARQVFVDRSIITGAVTATRLLFPDVPYICLNTSGLDYETIVECVLHGANDLGIVLLPGVASQSPFFTKNITTDALAEIADATGFSPTRRTADFLRFGE
ncbi:MAG: hypothetical protein WC712_03095 [Candidatus Brocadiia bacterium]